MMSKNHVDGGREQYSRTIKINHNFIAYYIGNNPLVPSTEKAKPQGERGAADLLHRKKNRGKESVKGGLLNSGYYIWMFAYSSTVTIICERLPIEGK